MILAVVFIFYLGFGIMGPNPTFKFCKLEITDQDH